jgi:hypothetical protein
MLHVGRGEYIPLYPARGSLGLSRKSSLALYEPIGELLPITKRS